MTKITDNVIKEALDACKPGISASVGSIVTKTLIEAGVGGMAGGGIASEIPIVGTVVGAALGSAVGAVTGLVTGITDATTPDAACVAKNLQSRSR